MGLRSVVVSVFVLVLLVVAPRADVVVGIQGGAGHFPLSDWKDFSSAAALGYEADQLALCWELSTTWRFAEHHAARLSVERITTSAVATFDIAGFTTATVDWDFETIPICVTYEYTLRHSVSNARTILGVGAGLYMSEVTGKALSSDPLVASYGERSGDGYGLHGYLRQTAPIAERLLLSGMVRGRWADGMAFDDNSGDIPVEFTGVDVSIGLEWEI